MRPPDTVLPDGLDPFEIQEAYRALKGHALRIEIYADDGSPAAANPYTVTEQNFTIRCLQNMGANLHAVFFVQSAGDALLPLRARPRRPAGRPRDHPGDRRLRQRRCAASRSAIRAAPGTPPPEPALSAATQAMLAYDQARLHVRATEQRLHQRDRRPGHLAGRLPGAAARRRPTSAEITGVAPSVKGTGITSLFTFDEIDGAGGVWPTVWTGAHDMPYEAIPASDVDGTGTPGRRADPAVRRAASGSCYRSDDLTALLPPGQLQPLALPGESYQAALTPGLLSAIFGALVPAATLTEGGYVQLPGETGWWMPSGRVFYSPGDGDTPAAGTGRPRSASSSCRAAPSIRSAASPASTTTATPCCRPRVTDPVGNVTTAAQRLPRPAAGDGHRPERQPGLRPPSTCSAWSPPPP